MDIGLIPEQNERREAVEFFDLQVDEVNDTLNESFVPSSIETVDSKLVEKVILELIKSDPRKVFTLMDLDDEGRISAESYISWVKAKLIPLKRTCDDTDLMLPESPLEKAIECFFRSVANPLGPKTDGFVY